MDIMKQHQRYLLEAFPSLLLHVCPVRRCHLSGLHECLAPQGKVSSGDPEAAGPIRYVIVS